MNIKRTSYFTFLVAITTLATVTSCSKVRGQALPDRETIPGEIVLDDNQLFDICLEGLERPNYHFELVRVLGKKGLKAGKFKLAIDASGTLSVYLVIDKDYKGPVSTKIFDSKGHEEYGKLALLSKDKRDNSLFAISTFDKRTGIAAKNRILLE